VAQIHSLTTEQLAVVNHPRGRHARVLAVAGSGKTTTMAYRVKHLLNSRVSPKSICILMFNRMARVQFAQKLEELGLPPSARPDVNTFHSYSYGLIAKAVEKGWIPGVPQMWVGDLEELVRRTVHQAIHNVVEANDLDEENLDADEIMEAIALWKGALISPERAGYHGNRAIPLVYKEFERLRNEKQGVTFDDFVPLAVDILENDRQHMRELVSHYDYVIVDEYQDINYGQQRLIELLAGDQADIMVVGDDDQTIYEWRGARPDYILKFGHVFTNKPYIDYTLSRSFRFGPVIAQCAQNVIELNSVRVRKSIVAHNMTLPAQIHIIVDKSGQEFDVCKELAEQVVQAVKETSDPRNVIVLGRMFSQLNGLEMEFLSRAIPYRVEGRLPFFKRREIQVLLDYLRLAMAFDNPVNQELEKLLLSIANMPNRKLSRKHLTNAMRQAHESRRTTRNVLMWLASDIASPLTRRQRQSAEDLLDVLDRLHEILHSESPPHAGVVIRWLVQAVDFVSHFENYYGMGEASEDRKRSVTWFCDHADSLAKQVPALLVYVDTLDTTRGVPEEEQIVLTTVFRTKGLEYDYVVIPCCEEGYMPILFGGPNLVYDLQGIVDEPEQSQVIENERRLFYVAITRARKVVFIGTSQSKASGQQPNAQGGGISRFVHETQYAAAVDAMTALQRLANGAPNAKGALLTAVRTHGSNKRIMNSLLTNYLPLIGDADLLAEVRALEATLPAEDFQYPVSFQESSGFQQPEAWSEREPRWWEDESSF